jgi:Pex2 / Pex12 amino terminal region
VLLHSLLPLVNAKLASLAPPEEDAAPAVEPTPVRASEDNVAVAAAEHASGNGIDLASAPASPERCSEDCRSAHGADADRANSRPLATAPVAPPAPAHAVSAQARVGVVAAPSSARAHMRQHAARAGHAVWARRCAILCGAAAWLPLLSQLHLALFYLRGVFFEAPKRLAGVRLVYVGAMSAARKYYGVMGALLLLQVAVRALQRVRCAIALAGCVWMALQSHSAGSPCCCLCVSVQPCLCKRARVNFVALVG